MEGIKYSIPNQPQRFAQAKLENNQRVLDIDSVYRPDFKGKTVLITGTSIQKFSSHYYPKY